MTSTATKTKQQQDVGARNAQAVWMMKQSNTSYRNAHTPLSIKDKDAYCADRATD